MTTQENFEAAQRAFRGRRYQAALALCRQIEVAEPAHSGCKMLLANLAHIMGQPKQAEKLLREALALDSNNIEAVIGLAALLANGEHVEESVCLCEAAIQQRPDLGAPHFHLGRCRLTQGKHSEAEACFLTALRFTPKLASGHHQLGTAQRKLGKTREALASLRRAVELDPGTAEAHADLAVLLLEWGDTEGAIEELRNAGELSSETAFAQLCLGRAAMESEDFEQAEYCFRNAISLDPKAFEAYVLLARLLYQRGMFEESQPVIETAISLNPMRPDAYCIAIAGKRLTETDRGLVTALEAILSSGLPPLEAQPVHYSLGKAYDDLAEPSTAIDHFQSANRIAREILRLAGKIFDIRARESEIETSIRHFDKSFFEASRELGSDSEKPVFIVGMPRSGTTLAEQILSSHPEIGAAGELGQWGLRAVAPFLSNTMDVPSVEIVRASTKRALEKLEVRAPGKSKITEKTPQNYLLLGPLLAAFHNAHIIHCVRHPIDTCLSIYMTPFMSGPEYGHDFTELAEVYRLYQLLMGHWRGVLPSDRLLELPYEDLVLDTEPTIRKMISFLGLPWNDSCLRHEESEHAISTPSVWQARQPIFDRSVGRWKIYEPWLGDLAGLISEGRW